LLWRARWASSTDDLILQEVHAKAGNEDSESTHGQDDPSNSRNDEPATKQACVRFALSFTAHRGGWWRLWEVHTYTPVFLFKVHAWTAMPRRAKRHADRFELFSIIAYHNKDSSVYTKS